MFTHFYPAQMHYIPVMLLVILHIFFICYVKDKTALNVSNKKFDYSTKIVPSLESGKVNSYEYELRKICNTVT